MTKSTITKHRDLKPTLLDLYKRSAISARGNAPATTDGEKF